MNLQSRLILILILAFSSRVIYTGFIKKSKSGCGSCSGCSLGGKSCSSKAYQNPIN